MLIDQLKEKTVSLEILQTKGPNLPTNIFVEGNSFLRYVPECNVVQLHTSTAQLS